MKRAAGFTLLEVLATLAVFGLLTLTLTQGMRFGQLAWQRQERQTAGIAELEAADRLLRSLIEHADPGTEENPAGFAGTASTLNFRTELPLSAGPEAGRRIVAALGIDAERRLVLRWVPYLHARRLAPPPPMRSVVLVQGVERLEARYWRRPRPPLPGGWTTAMTAAAPPPLIALRLVFQESAHKTWPEIAAAPRRERPAE